MWKIGNLIAMWNTEYLQLLQELQDAKEAVDYEKWMLEQSRNTEQHRHRESI